MFLHRDGLRYFKKILEDLSADFQRADALMHLNLRAFIEEIIPTYLRYAEDIERQLQKEDNVLRKLQAEEIVPKVLTPLLHRDFSLNDGFNKIQQTIYEVERLYTQFIAQLRDLAKGMTGPDPREQVLQHKDAFHAKLRELYMTCEGIERESMRLAKTLNAVDEALVEGDRGWGVVHQFLQKDRNEVDHFKRNIESWLDAHM